MKFDWDIITTLDVAYLLYCSTIFQHNSWAHWCFCSTFMWIWKVYHNKDWALACTIIHEQLFQVPHYCGPGDLSSVASAAKMNVSMMGQEQDYRVNGSKVPVKQVQQFLCLRITPCNRLFGHWSDIWETNSTVTKWKWTCSWMFFKFKSPVAFLNACQVGVRVQYALELC